MPVADRAAFVSRCLLVGRSRPRSSRRIDRLVINDQMVVGVDAICTL
jgi:hypothetical protein